MNGNKAVVILEEDEERISSNEGRCRKATPHRVADISEIVVHGATFKSRADTHDVRHTRTFASNLI